MELVQDLFVTVSLALLFSFIVAKLVSMAMAGDGVRGSESKSSGNVVEEETGFEERLRVEGFASERRVEFLGEEATMKVDEFVGGPVKVDPDLGAVHGGEEVVEGPCELGNLGDGGGIEAVVGSKEESAVGGSSEKLLEVAAIAGGSELEGIEGEETGCGLDGLAGEEKLENTESAEIGVELGTDSSVIQQSDDVDVARCVKDQGSGGDDEDDWEGIERSELEEVFAAAAKFVSGEGIDDRLANVSNDVRMQLYGLHKVATEGPCYEPQPLALKVSARAKWNAWQKLGNMNPEEAMEQYVALLSDNVPGWMEENYAGDSSEALLPGASDPNLSTFLHHQPKPANESKLELKSVTEGGDLGGGSNSVNKDKE